MKQINIRATSHHQEDMIIIGHIQKISKKQLMNMASQQNITVEIH